jgi:hypothetical protein
LTDASLTSSISATSLAPNPSNVAQHQHRPLARGEALQPRDERERDRLLGLIARVGPGRAVGDPFEHQVRVGLEPERLGDPRRRGQVGPRLDRAAAGVAQRVQAAVGRDPV